MRYLDRLLAALILVGGSAAVWFLPGAGASAVVADRAMPAALRRQAITFYERRLKEDPRSALDMAQLAALLMEDGRMRGDESAFVQAESLARRSLDERTRRNGRSGALLANALVAQHRFGEAQQVSRELVDWEPETPAYRALLAETSMETGAYEEAIRMLGSIRPQREELGIAPRFARWAELTGQPGEARRILRAARDEALRRPDLSDEQRAWFSLRLADVELRHGNLRNASAAIKSGLKHSPEDWRLILARARLESARGEWSDAVRSGEAVLAAVPSADAFALLATAHAALGQNDEASGFSMALEAIARRSSGGLHRTWAFALLDQGREASELVSLAAADTLARRDAHTLDLLGWALHRAGRSRDALPLARRAIALGSVEPMLRFHAGMIELAAGDPDSARTHLQVAKRGRRALTNSQHVETREALARLKHLDRTRN